MTSFNQIVIVEDHEYTNQLLVKMLSRHFQINCIPFTSAEPFREWFHTHMAAGKNTVFMLDIILSENPMAKNGIDLATEIAEALTKAQIIILTGCPLNDEIRSRVKKLQNQNISICIFEKPVDPDKLLKQIENIMEVDTISDQEGTFHEDSIVFTTNP